MGGLFSKVKYDRQIYSLKDGGELAIDWLVHTSEATRDLIVCVPGLSGDSAELYCTQLAEMATKRNLDFVVVNYRGTSGVRLKVSNNYI